MCGLSPLAWRVPGMGVDTEVRDTFQLLKGVFKDVYLLSLVQSEC